jgi:hypothetical protein
MADVAAAAADVPALVVLAPDVRTWDIVTQTSTEPPERVLR